MLNSIEKFKVAILHLNRDWNHCFGTSFGLFYKGKESKCHSITCIEWTQTQSIFMSYMNAIYCWPEGYVNVTTRIQIDHSGLAENIALDGGQGCDIIWMEMSDWEFVSIPWVPSLEIHNNDVTSWAPIGCNIFW